MFGLIYLKIKNCIKKLKINCLDGKLHPTLTQEPLLMFPKYNYHDKDSTVIQKKTGVEGKAKDI